MADPVGTATLAAAGRLEQLDGDGDRVRERELQLAIASELPSAETERRVHVPGWDPQPGAVDILVRGEDGGLATVIETKFKAGNDIYECLWDFAKVLSLTRGDDAPAGYLVVGTTRAGWDRHATRELFSDGSHMLVDAIRQHLAWWDKYILGDSTGRPTSVPAVMDVRVVAREVLSLQGVDWELRAVRVVGGEQMVPFADGRPV